MVTDLSNICAVVIFRVKVWPPLSMLLQAVTIRNSAIQGLHSHKGNHTIIIPLTFCLSLKIIILPFRYFLIIFQIR